MLSAGTKVGPYEIVASLGSGGMGEVYHAWDDRLARAVAIKVLPAGFANPDRLERFVREARIAGLLHHPNVLSIHDVGGLDGAPYLVTELLEGETLRVRLRRGSLPPSKAVEVTLQVAAGLAAIHSAGILHRDLKPENLFVTRDDVVKILDFGLAMPVSAPVDQQDAVTAVGEASLLPGQFASGTVAYMSPEQGLGFPADTRSDIFSVGAILFEMLTGTRAFGRDTRLQTMQAIIEDDPLSDMRSVCGRIPAHLERVLRHMLEKDPGARFQSVRDLAFALEPLAQETHGVRLASTAAAGTGRSRARPVWGLAVTLGALLLGMLFLSQFNEPPPVIRASLPMAPQYEGDGLAVARDGARIVYAAVGNGLRQLYVRALNQMEAYPLAGTDAATEPFFSYDGKWVGFFANGKLKKVALSGGAPQTICDAIGKLGATWAPDDTIYFTPSTGEGIWSVSAEGGEPRALTTPDREAQEKSHRFPELLPGGRALLFYTHFTDMASLDDARIEAFSLDTGARRVLIENGHRAQYLSTGHLLYQYAATLLAVPFDVQSLAVKGPPVAVLDGIRLSSWSLRQFAVSAAGLLVYAPGNEQAVKRELVWVDRRGDVTSPVSDVRAEYQEPHLSTDGRRLLVEIVGANNQAWLYELDRRIWTRLNSTWDSVSPVWAPDGTRLAFGSSRSGVLSLSWSPLDDSARVEQLVQDERTQWPTSWSPDGRHLVFTVSGTPSRDIWTLDLSEGGKPEILVQTPFAEEDAKFSPDGRWIAYTSNESGRPEVYVQAFARDVPRTQVSNQGGQWPIWARNGRELFYRTPGVSPLPDQMMVVSVEQKTPFRASPPTPLFDARMLGRYDVSPDGQRFLMVRSSPDAPRDLHLVWNWFEDVKGIVAQPAGR